jgi:hypothetical protein
MILEELGDLEGAISNYERALEMFIRFKGNNHLETKTVRDNLELLMKRRQVAG